MKKLIVICSMLMSLTAAAQMTFQGQCQIQNGARAVCQFCNYQISAAPLKCRVNMQGQTVRGFFATGFVDGVVFPNQCIWGEVFAQNAFIDPLRFANATVNCRF